MKAATTTHALSGIKVGDTIAVRQQHYSRLGAPEDFESTVTAVGRKYVTAVQVGKDPFFAMRFDIEFGGAVNAHPAARAWRTVAERDAYLRTYALRERICRAARDLSHRSSHLERLTEPQLLQLWTLLTGQKEP